MISCMFQISTSVNIIVKVKVPILFTLSYLNNRTQSDSKTVVRHHICIKIQKISGPIIYTYN